LTLSKSNLSASISCAAASDGFDLVIPSNTLCSLYRCQRPPPRRTNREQHRNLTDRGDDPQQPRCFARFASEQCCLPAAAVDHVVEDVTTPAPPSTRTPPSRKGRGGWDYERPQPPRLANPNRCRNLELLSRNLLELEKNFVRGWTRS
jgi:hypothetical protein